MSQEFEESRNLDYEAEGASVLDVHESVQREKVLPMTEGMEPAGRWVMILSAIVIAFGGGFLFANSNGFKDSIYTTHYYHPDPRPDLGGGAGVIEELNWIDKWMKGGKKVYANCVTCHQPSGLGAPGQFPPLVGSEWVDGGTERLGAILMSGINGPFNVAGQTYNQLMPAWGGLSNEEVAQVITYIRREYGSLAEGDDGVVTTEMVEAAREKYAGQAPWSEAGLLEIPEDEMLPGSKVDLETGEPVGP